MSSLCVCASALPHTGRPRAPAQPRWVAPPVNRLRGRARRTRCGSMLLDSYKPPVAARAARSGTQSLPADAPLAHPAPPCLPSCRAGPGRHCCPSEQAGQRSRHGAGQAPGGERRATAPHNSPLPCPPAAGLPLPPGPSCHRPAPSVRHCCASLPLPQDVTADYQLGKVLGRGQFGTTRLAEAKSQKKQFACKSIAKRKLT